MGGPRHILAPTGVARAARPPPAPGAAQCRVRDCMIPVTWGFEITPSRTGDICCLPRFYLLIRTAHAVAGTIHRPGDAALPEKNPGARLTGGEPSPGPGGGSATGVPPCRRVSRWARVVTACATSGPSRCLLSPRSPGDAGTLPRLTDRNRLFTGPLPASAAGTQWEDAGRGDPDRRGRHHAASHSATRPGMGKTWPPAP
jgi:hypothetical protein